MKKQGFAALGIAFFLSLVLMGGCQEQPSTAPEITSAASGSVSSLAKDAGFDEFGYNYQARIFSGPADGVDRKLDGKIWGDSTYAKDHLVMKWSKAWDDAKYNDAPWTADAWTDNEWNGNVVGGSGESAHYKIIWVGSDLQAGKYWREGGYEVWGEFEVIMDHGKTSGQANLWYAHAKPTGYGVGK